MARLEEFNRWLENPEGLHLGGNRGQDTDLHVEIKCFYRF